MIFGPLCSPFMFSLSASVVDPDLALISDPDSNPGFSISFGSGLFMKIKLI
jgi:hypothetical protein